MSTAGRFTQDPSERLHYVLDFSQWLDSTEVLVSASYSVTPVTPTPLAIDGAYIAEGNLACVFYASGGEDGQKYKILAQVGTSTGQVVERVVILSVKAN